MIAVRCRLERLGAAPGGDDGRRIALFARAL
jgi:hypothetical protein